MTESRLWTEKYAPTKPEEILGQGKALSETMEWFAGWKRGKALLLHGPPGSGKTALVEAIAKQKDLQIVRVNPSDGMGADAIETNLLAGSQTHSLFHKGKVVLVDEIDGISGNDRGGVPSIINVIKESSFPVVLTANDPWKQKFQPLRKVVNMVKFNRVMTPSIEKHLKDICKKEGLECEDAAVKSLARWSQGDMRSAIFDLQMATMGRKGLDLKSLETLGFRERESQIFSIMPTLFQSGNINAARKLIQDSDKDPDEILLWIETNIPLVFREPEALVKAYDTLSKADMMRAKVHIQQNWRFKALMIDIMAGVSLSGEPAGGYIPWQTPQRISMMGGLRSKREGRMNAAEKIAHHTHCSKRIAVREYFPYMRFFRSLPEWLDEDDVKSIKEN